MPESADKPVLLWLENDYPLNSRSARILNSLAEGGVFDVHCCVWARSMRPAADLPPNFHVYAGPRSSGFGRLLIKALTLPTFALFARRVRRRLRPRLIVCSFWDMAAIAALIASHTPILYDVIDMPRGGGLQLSIARLIERLALTRISAVTLASRFYKRFYKRIRACLLLENLPNLPPPTEMPAARSSDPRIAFVGELRYPTTLRPLLTACVKANYPCALIGDGHCAATLASEFAGTSNIRFTGRYRYEDLPGILRDVDILWAAYPAADFNVQHAISNKFFESIYYARPAVFSRNTRLGDLVESEGIGFVLDATDEGEVSRWLDEIVAHPNVLAERAERLVRYRERHLTRLRWADQQHALNEFCQTTAFESSPRRRIA